MELMPLKIPPRKEKEEDLYGTTVVETIQGVQSILIPSDTNQDFLETGKTGSITWLLVCDGHGTNTYINWIRDRVEWKRIAMEIDPVRTLCRLYEKSNIYMQTKDSLLSGSTFSMARILETPESGECLIECINVGDSTTMVFINDTLAYINRGHTLENPEEIERLASLRNSMNLQYSIADGKKPAVLSENTITMAKSRTVEFNYKLRPTTPFSKYKSTHFSNTHIVRLVPSQSLGHLGVTGIKPEKHTIHCYKGDKIRVIVCSDGFTDMLCMENPADILALCTLSCKDLGLFALNRWKQKWQYIDPITKQKLGETEFQSGRDDIAVALWDRSPP
jgi:serine/threonine protein phosphatase PrpC